MNREAAVFMINPNHDKKATLGTASDDHVIRHVPPDLRRVNALWIVRDLIHLGTRDPALRVVPLQVPDIRRIPHHGAVVHLPQEVYTL